MIAKKFIFYPIRYLSVTMEVKTAIQWKDI